MSNVVDGCPLCNQKFEKNGSDVAIYDCGHRFHLSCILKNTKYYSSSCPTCSKVQNLNLTSWHCPRRLLWKEYYCLRW